jgi:hypothetical protein
MNSGLDVDGQAAVAALVALHVKKHGGDSETSLAAIPAGQSSEAPIGPTPYALVRK